MNNLLRNKRNTPCVTPKKYDSNKKNSFRDTKNLIV